MTAIFEDHALDFGYRHFLPRGGYVRSWYGGFDGYRNTDAGSGDVISETLDIRISDEVGTRDYEMYSGGEAFRVDLALRIALARLLAERAGATLPTLIIDEGFATSLEYSDGGGPAFH